MGARETISWDAEELTEQLGLLVEIVTFASGQRLDERFVSRDRRIDKSGVHPQQEVGVQRAILAPSNPTVRLVNHAGSGERGLAVAEHDRHRHVDGPSQTPNGMRAKVRVLVDPRGDLGMGKLHQQRAPTAEEQDILTIHTTCDRAFRIEAFSHQAIISSRARAGASHAVAASISWL